MEMGYGKSQWLGRSFFCEASTMKHRSFSISDKVPLAMASTALAMAQ
jgi:hypothetical protein